MKYVVSLNGKKYEVEVNETQAAVLSVSEDAVLIAAESEKSVSEPALTKKSGKEEPSDGISIKSPMPGTILSVNLNIGDIVKKDDVMFVLEAMKMENDIVAPKDGIVKQILAEKGDSVNTDDI
ncbi:MAG TPA: biotin/lipoyl-containing protein, partial [Clostridia bacterium]|nr:biotin/lipoyl-containing protein [Clostridia bacterium]